MVTFPSSPLYPSSWCPSRCPSRPPPHGAPLSPLSWLRCRGVEKPTGGPLIPNMAKHWSCWNWDNSEARSEARESSEWMMLEEWSLGCPVLGTGAEIACSCHLTSTVIEVKFGVSRDRMNRELHRARESLDSRDVDLLPVDHGQEVHCSPSDGLSCREKCGKVSPDRGKLVGNNFELFTAEVLRLVPEVRRHPVDTF